MALINAKYDTVTGRIIGVTSETSSSGINDQNFDASEGQTEFVTNVDWTIQEQVDVYLNGRRMREGASHDFTKDAANNKITFTSARKEGDWIFTRILFTTEPFVDNEFDATEGQTSLDLSQTINGTQTIDVYMAGRLLREGAGNDYVRDTANDQIDLNFTLNGGEYLLVRMYND